MTIERTQRSRLPDRRSEKSVRSELVGNVCRFKIRVYLASSILRLLVSDGGNGVTDSLALDARGEEAEQAPTCGHLYYVSWRVGSGREIFRCMRCTLERASEFWSLVFRIDAQLQGTALADVEKTRSAAVYTVSEASRTKCMPCIRKFCLQAEWNLRQVSSYYPQRCTTCLHHPMQTSATNSLLESYATW